MWTLILFVVSLLGIVGLLITKNIQRRKGTVGAPAITSRLDERLVHITHHTKNLPLTLQGFLEEVGKVFIIRVSAAMLRVLHFTERKLIRLINLVKGRGALESNKGSVSFFLQNVAAYKESQTEV